MNVWNDRKAQSHTFDVGDQVLVLLPVQGSALQGHFSRPYIVMGKVGNLDYLIATPGR